MITKNTIFTLAALIVAAPLSAMESQPSIWSSVWKQSKEYVNTVINSASELTPAQRYVAAATVGLAAVGAGYYWFTKNAKPQAIVRSPVKPIDTVEEMDEPVVRAIPRSPALQIDTFEEINERAVNNVMPSEQSPLLANAQGRAKKTVRINEEKNQVKAIPTCDMLRLQQMAHDPVFVGNLQELQKAVTADCIMVNKLVSRAAINRSILHCELQSLKVWNQYKDYFGKFSVKNLKACTLDLEKIAQLPAPKTLAELQQMQQHLSALARDMALLIQRLRNALKE